METIELKNKITEIKNLIYGFNIKLDKTEKILTGQ